MLKRPNASSRKRLPRLILVRLASSRLIKLRPSKYLNNLVEQDHRFIKRLVKLGMGFFSFETAWRTLQGYETMNMLRKGQICGVEKRDNIKQVAFIASLFGVAV